MSLKKWLFILFLAFLVAGFGFFFFTTERREAERGAALSTRSLIPDHLPGVGQLAPDFELPDLTGRKVRLSDLRGKTVFLNIWATWCPPCIQEMPLIERLHRAMRGRSFIILAASQDTGLDSAAKVRKLVRELELTFPILLDPKRELTISYRLTGYPETFIIDKEGTIIQRIIGMRDWTSSEWMSALTQLAER